MKRRALLVVLVALACETAFDRRDRDDGASDAGSIDSGAFDAGLPPDGGSPEVDAGSTHPDAGAVDAGPTCPDLAECGDLECGHEPVCGIECGTCDFDERCEQGRCVPLPVGTFNGSVGGRTFVPADAIAHGSLRSLTIEVTSRADSCAIIVAGNLTANATEVALALQSSTNLVPGTYSLAAGPFGGSLAVFLASDASCHSLSNVNASSGTVTLTRVGLVSGGTTEGSFDLVFGADHVSGSFRATSCTFPEGERTGCQ